MRGKCERGRGSVNADGAGANVIQRKAKGYAGAPMASWENSERRGGNINTDGAGAEVFAGDGCSQGASFGPMALISRRWRGGRIYNNTRTREPLRRKCVKPRRSHNTFPTEDLRPFPSTSTPPRSADAHPQAAPCIPRHPHNPFPTEDLRPSPSVPRRAQKNGTAQWMCDAECLGRPSLRSVIGVGEPRAVRRRCGALAWRVGLRPQPWALRSRRCGRVLRA